jgi:hypothetical protein
MDLKQVRAEIQEKTKSPPAEKFYPITSNWIPVPDVLAILDRYERYWRGQSEKLLDKPDENARKLARQIREFLGTEV